MIFLALTTPELLVAAILFGLLIGFASKRQSR